MPRETKYTGEKKRSFEVNHQGESSKGGQEGVFDSTDLFKETALERKAVNEFGKGRMNIEKDEYGRSRAAVKGAERTNAAKDKDGKSIAAVKSAERMNAVRADKKMFDSFIDFETGQGE